MSSIGPTFVAVVGGIIALAMLAVAVSKKAQTPQVLTGAGQALSSVISAAVGPVSGSSTNQFGAATAPAGTVQ